MVDITVDQKLASVAEKLIRRRSFAKATLSDTLPTQTSPDGPSKEHSEQGRVKNDVYVQYIQAASKIGFVAFILATGLVQIAGLLANYTLRAWGEHNREAGSNKGVGVYVLGYGLFSLVSVVIGMISTVVLWVFCAVRSSQYLHDAVSCSSITSTIKTDLNYLSFIRCYRLLCALLCRSSNKHPLVVF